MVLVGDLQVVDGAQGLFAHVRKAGEGDPVRGQTHMDPAPHDLDVLGRGLDAAGEPPEVLHQFLVGVLVHRGQVDLHAAHGLQPVVVVAGKLVDVELFLEHVDERQEQFTLQAVLVEIAGMAVGGGHHHHAEVEHRLEQTPQDHGVGDVQDLELVEAQQPGVPGDPRRQLRHHVFGESPALLAELVEAAVHHAHEFVEMGAPLVLHRHALEEQVHEHGLAASHRAVDVDALGRIRAPASQAEAFLPALLAHGGGVVVQAVAQRLQLFHRQFLGGIRAEFPLFQHGAIEMDRSIGHGRLSCSFRKANVFLLRLRTK